MQPSKIHVPVVVFFRRSSQKGRTPRTGDRDQRPLIQVECPEQEEGEEEDKAPTERRRRVARGSSRSRERSGKRAEEKEKEKEDEDNIEEGYQSDSETSDDDDDDDSMPFMHSSDLYVGGECWYVLVIK